MHRQPGRSSSAGPAVPRKRGDAPLTSAIGTVAEDRSPQARGCTGHARALRHLRLPFPASAGMHRPPTTMARPSATVPRKRGDAPSNVRVSTAASHRSPQARGCTAGLARLRHRLLPFPASAGMHRPSVTHVLPVDSVPRKRGDAPPDGSVRAATDARSPQARGCTVNAPCSSPDLSPFPASAGMHRSTTAASTPRRSVPRKRGDAPATSMEFSRAVGRSPQARGCTEHRQLLAEPAEPFPASAGMHRAPLA